MFSVSPYLRKFFGLTTALWFAVASCALGCAQTTSFFQGQNSPQSQALASLVPEMDFSSEPAACHQQHNQPADSGRKGPQSSSTLSCCPLDATLPLKWQPPRYISVEGIEANPSAFIQSNLFPEVPVDGTAFSNGRETHVRLRVFRI